MTRVQMIKALQERGWGKAAPAELEKCYTYELRRVLLQKEGQEGAGGKDHSFFSDSRRAWNK